MGEAMKSNTKQNICGLVLIVLMLLGWIEPVEDREHIQHAVESGPAHDVINHTVFHASQAGTANAVGMVAVQGRAIEYSF